MWHECAAVLLLFCCVSLGNSILSFLWFPNPVSLQLFLAYLYATLLFGIPITLTIVALEYQRRLRTRLAELLPKDTDAQAEETVTFHDTSVRGNDLTLPLSDFLYAESQKNCVDIYFLREGHVEHQQLRTTLTSVLADHRQPQQHPLRPWQFQRLPTHRGRRAPYSARVTKLCKDLAVICRVKG